MSAFVVDKAHIDVLVNAGLQFPRHGPMRWPHPAVGEEDRRDAYQRGEPWEPAALRLYNERRHELTRASAETVGAMLWAQNRSSVDFRYDEDYWEDVDQFGAVSAPLDPVAVLKALDCYEYQSCEHPDWPQSMAHAYCQALRQLAVRRLPGYD